MPKPLRLPAILSEAGQGLIEVLIALGLLSVVILGVAATMNMSQKATLGDRIVAARDRIVANISRMAVDPKALGRNSAYFVTDKKPLGYYHHPITTGSASFPANTQLGYCVLGGGTCTAGVAYGMTLFDNDGTVLAGPAADGTATNPVDNPAVYDESGTLCAGAGRDVCPIIALASFTADCGTGVATCGPARYINVTFTVKQWSTTSVPRGGTVLKPYTSLVSYYVPVTANTTGTANYLPKWSSSTALTASAVYESGGNVGIGTITPGANLQVVGSSTSTPAMIISGNTSTYWPQSSIWFNDSAVGGHSYSIGNGGTTGKFAIADQTAAVARLTIDTTGNVGIGTTSPAQKLEVNGNIKMSGTTIYGAGSANTYGSLTIDGIKNNWAGINFTSSGANLGTFMVGTAPVGLSNFTGFYNTTDSAWDWYVSNASGPILYSDRRLKKDIHPLENVLDNILKLQPVSYHWIDAKKDAAVGETMGLIAQDVEKIFPKIVTTDPITKNLPGGTKMMAYSDFITPIIQAIKEFYGKWQEDHEQNIARDKRMAKLERENSALKNYICKRDPQADFCAAAKKPE